MFVNVHVDRPWQDPNNAVLAKGATRYPNVVVADWATLAAQNPQWFGADGTHLAIDGSGADALAQLIASTLTNGLIGTLKRSEVNARGHRARSAGRSEMWAGFKMMETGVWHTLWLSWRGSEQV